MSKHYMHPSFRATLDEAYELQGRHYNVVRFFKDSGSRRIVRRRVTLEEARTHCSDPETSSSTCTRAAGIRRTRLYGPWFDGYEER